MFWQEKFSVNNFLSLLAVKIEQEKKERTLTQSCALVSFFFMRVKEKERLKFFLRPVVELIFC